MTALTGSRLIDSVNYRVLKPVRGTGPTVHLVPRDVLQNGQGAVPSLCGAQPGLTERGTPRWRVVHAKGHAICMACHAASCAEPTRIDWS